MIKLNDLKDGLDFSKSEYDKKEKGKQGMRTFDGFLRQIINICKSMYKADINDAIYIANDAFYNL